MKSSLAHAIRIAIAASSLSLVATAHADNASGFTITPSIGYTLFDNEMRIENTEHAALGLGYQFSSPWGVELTYKKASTDTVNSGTSVDLEEIRLDAIYNFARDGQVQPFVLIGGGTQDWSTYNVDFENSMVNLGGGLKYWVNDFASVFTDMRIIQDIDNEDTSYAVGLGLSFFLGGSAPAAKPVVTSPADSDRDGVIDSQDRCPGTAPGAKVDAYGCDLVSDDDQDGVVNASDDCPDTSAGAKVDAKGCYIVITENKEITLKIEFETASYVIKPGAYSDVQAVAQFMKEYPLTDVNIEGHTDDAGSEAYNQTLSQNRANAVAQLLIDQYGVAASRVTATGYGEARPLVANDSAANRAQNRRVAAKITAQVQKVQK
jgi:OmpA-OmpF porin, OOP family